MSDGVIQIDRVGYVPILKGMDVANRRYIEFTAGMTIDADGSPHAYAPAPLKGLDALINAKDGHGRWVGVATDMNGRPYIQGKDDPAPGYYVSTTAMENRSLEAKNPLRYVDSEKVAFIALPGRRFTQWGLVLGDFCHVSNLEKPEIPPVAAVFADVGPYDHIGEGSIALAKLLGINPDARVGGITKRVVRYRIFPSVSPLLPPIPNH